MIRNVLTVVNKQNSGGKSKHRLLIEANNSIVSVMHHE